MTRQGKWETDTDEIRNAADWAWESPPNGTYNAGKGLAYKYPLNDHGNAKRFVEKFGTDYRYNLTAKLWLHFDGVRWAQDAAAQAQAQEDARTIAADLERDGKKVDFDLDAATKKDHPDHYRQEWRKAMLGWAKASGMAFHIQKLLSLASSDKTVRVKKADLDANPMLLAFPNGYLNLNTDELTPPRRDALVTKVCAAAYHAEATHPLWTWAQDRFMPNREKRRDFFVAQGYCVTGRAKEHSFIAKGDTKCGKTTVCTAIKNALGDHAHGTGIETFASNKYAGAGGTREDLIALDGTRLVVASETNENQRLNAAQLKRIAGGGDTLPVRGLYGSQYEMLPTFGLWLLTNFLPRVPADDDGLWERLHVFTFDQFIPPAERDEVKRDQTEDPAISGSAVLASVLAGWRYYRDTLQQKLVLPSVATETADARNTLDLMKLFIAERCDEGPNLRCEVDVLKRCFRAFLRSEGVKEAYSDSSRSGEGRIERLASEDGLEGGKQRLAWLA